MRAESRSRRAELRASVRLASVPFAVALLLALLLLPRRAIPDSGDVPVPIADAHALAHSAAVDRDLAARARAELLPGAVRALGSAMRIYHSLEGSELASPATVRARRAIEAAAVDALPAGDDALLRLRAIDLEGFLAEVGLFQSTGKESGELVALAGGFIRAMTSAGWCDGRRVLPREPALRTMYKQMWNELAGLEGRPAFDPTLDEQRALYALYISSPHPSASMRDAIEAARRGATGWKACVAVREAERGATEAWRLERIGRLMAIDPSYPGDFARGVSNFRRADYSGASQAFRAWIGAHPDGDLALRARAFLRASEAEQE